MVKCIRERTVYLLVLAEFINQFTLHGAKNVKCQNKQDFREDKIKLKFRNHGEMRLSKCGNIDMISQGAGRVVIMGLKNPIRRLS
jgi:hypothetical protein